MIALAPHILDIHNPNVKIPLVKIFCLFNLIDGILYDITLYSGRIQVTVAKGNSLDGWEIKAKLI